MTITETTTDTRESLLAAYDEWRARRNELDRREDSPYELVFTYEWEDSDREAAEMVGRMGRWLAALRVA